MPRSAHPSATIFGFGTAKHEEPREGGTALVDRREERAPHNDPHKLTKAAEPWLGGGAAVGGSNCTPASRRLQFAPAAAC